MEKPSKRPSKIVTEEVGHDQENRIIDILKKQVTPTYNTPAKKSRKVAKGNVDEGP